MRFAPLAAVLAALAVFSAPASARVWKQTWELRGRPIVRVATNDAHVSLHRGIAGQATARVEYTVSVWGFHSTVREPEVYLEHVGDSIIVRAKSHSNLVVFGGSDERFHIDVTLPPESDVRVRSRDGAVECEPLSGNIDLETGDGHILVHGAKGVVRLWTGDGGIEAEDLDGDVTVHTGDGRVRLSGRFDGLQVSSSDGRVETSVARGSALAKPWNLSSGDGSISLLIPRNLSALLDASTGDGHVSVDLPVSVTGGLSSHALRGSLNGGTIPLRIRTSDGSIRLGLSE